MHDTAYCPFLFACGRRAARGPGSRDPQRGERAQHEEHADQAELFGDEGEHEVGVDFRQVLELLAAVAESLSEEAALAEGDVLSPARFGMSVHNAILGVHSIANDNRRSLQALAASGDELAALFSEARGYLAEGEARVIAVFSDAPVPARFIEHTPPSRGTAAVALVFTADRGRRVRSKPATDTNIAPGAHGAPQPADVIVRDGNEGPQRLIMSFAMTVAMMSGRRRWPRIASLYLRSSFGK